MKPITFTHLFKFDPRLTSDQLGKEKYAKATTAILELISNSLDANATLVEVILKENALQGLDSIVVKDNGIGISTEAFENKFLCVGSKTPITKNKFGRFGLGRFSVFRLGAKSAWSTTSKIDEKTYERRDFNLDNDQPNSIDGTHTKLSSGPTGTLIEVFNLFEDVTIGLSTKTLRNEILSSFFVFLIGNTKRKILLNGEEISPDEYISSIEISNSQVVIDQDRRVDISLSHIWLKRNIERTEQERNLLLFGSGKLVHQTAIEARTPPNYICLADSNYFAELSISNRESIATLDPNFNQIVESIQRQIQHHQSSKKNETAILFIEDARKQEFYPYRDANPTAQNRAKQALYDVALEKINEHADISKLAKRAQAVVFRLLDRAMTNSNILDVLEEVAKLSDEDTDKFKRILERTTLEQIIRLGDEVSRRLEFLNSLHALTYGDLSKKVKERTQLHKVLEQHVWIFGEKYHLSTSDKSFRTLIANHRKQLKLRDVPSEELEKIQDVNKIPDLFMTAQRVFPIEPKFHHLIVELKAPKVPIKEKEIAQIKKYAELVRKSPQLVKDQAVWELFLVSSDIEDSVDTERFQENRPKGLLLDNKSVKVWVFRWSEIIQKAREEMTLVSEHLKLKTEELSVSEDLKREFPFLKEIGAAAH